MNRLKRYFITGLIVFLPIFFTFYVLFIIFKLIDNIFGGIVNAYLKAQFGFRIPGLGFLLGLAMVLLTGFISSLFLTKKAVPAVEKWFVKLPGIRQIYPAMKQIVGFLFSREKAAIKKVVLVEYPSKGIWSVGFMTNEGFREAQEKTGQGLVQVLIGSTPTPLSGYLILVPKDSVKVLDISIEEGIKLIVSGGILNPTQNNKKD